ncbi:hypothetical protein BDV96DRAFT_502348 [Lophiotrema nucula]|uniref:Chitin-binding type-4 domain-containing protein n=1 Tax=Lophiotrema nucula TaxID=690887 RepID=A0A6A5YRQ0_9PLEO|nr:hypothetical protein BDV96DRAFT_502348 [Lophiotrema nucula]
MSVRSIILAAAAILTTGNAHMIMKSPVPYAVDKIDSSPISKAQYPCKAQNGFSFTTATAMKAGEPLKVKLTGSAIHGGGGCQISIAQGNSPTADTVFKVVNTIAGCPTHPDDELDFTLPEGTPNGNLTLSWSWFSRLAGTHEMYHNCAPITVTGGADDTKAFDALPNMLVANLDETCQVPANMNVKYPDPGSALETEKDTTGEFAAPTGSNCGSTGNGNGGSPSGGAPAASSGAPAASSAPAEVPASSAPPAVSSAVASNPGGVFAPATCSQNGAVVCNGSTQFGLCNNGNVVWQDVAAGTTCSNGVISKRTAYNRQLKGRVARPRVVPGKDFTPDE